MIQATKARLAKALPAEFRTFVSRWRDHHSEPASRFCHWYLNGEHLGHLDTRHETLLLQAFEVAGLPFQRTARGIECTGQPNQQANQQALSAALMTAGNLLRAFDLVPGWRNEEQLLFNLKGEVIGQAERALFKTLGVRSRAVHVHVENHKGQVWTGVRASTKHENPNMFDNLAAGGIASAETVESTLWRELDEEAGLNSDDFEWIKKLPPHELVLSRPLLYGGWHHETVILFHGQLKPGRRPCNRDGEVGAFQLMNRAACVDAINAWQFTPDAALCCALALTPAEYTRKE